jgi:hypothetical protein
MLSPIKKPPLGGSRFEKLVLLKNAWFENGWPEKRPALKIRRVKGAGWMHRGLLRNYWGSREGKGSKG